jgi:hypothetical protein
MAPLVSRVYTVHDSVINEWEAVGRMTIRRGNRNTRRKPVSVPFKTKNIWEHLYFDQR